MSIYLLEKAGIDIKDIETIKQAGVEIVSFEGLNNRFLFNGLTIKKIEIAVRNGEVRDNNLLKETIESIIMNNLHK
jgi:hypothetical protein